MWYWHKNCDSDVNLDGKTIVITGANSGIGKETARKLYKRGARVLILCRNQQKANLAIEDIKTNIKQNHKLHDVLFKTIDLSDFPSIHKCAQQILNEETELHVLINNAGALGDPYTGVDYDIHFKANYLGHVLLTMLLLPKMAKSGSARVVNVGANSHNCPLYGGTLNMKDVRNNSAWGLGIVKKYCESKTAVMLFNKELARRLQDAGIDNVTTVSCHPGYTDSPFFRNLDKVYKGVHWLYEHLGSYWLVTPEQAADTVEYCVVEPELQSGEYYSYCVPRKPNTFIENTKVAKELWEESFKILDMKDIDLLL